MINNARARLMETTDMKRYKILATLLILGICLPLVAAEDEDHHDGEDGGVVRMTAAERTTAGISLAIVAKQTLNDHLRLPGEVVINAYQSANVTTRITAQVLARHVKLGETVAAGQPLVTLSSVAMAEAQGALEIADREWKRVRKLGKEAVSERRYTEAQVMQRQALGKVLAYGMTSAQATALLSSGDAASANGEFDLLSPQVGTVLMDDFIVGELIEPGRVLFSISDETTLWIEASTVPSDLKNLAVGAPARIDHGSDHWIEGRVIQMHHRLDETTRRQGVRIEVDNSDDHLHPGQFVEAEVSTGAGPVVLAVPAAAVTLMAGVPTVFKLGPDNEFQPQPIDVGRVEGEWTEVLAGLVGGEQIAVEGVFTIKSLILKSSIGDEH
ncbi:MAG: efflux RND transporter periplasmic adaptor subunit [Gammaproteobacteria bacterium]|nr:MAG: efflux RND transporter periplasmic adaptor subunit [Gammaproteobacteria bacterium]RLA37120.1 MAG: efflux RND transporter periplasmic adaptor subunit [Gammaproteobacteria bacterium]